MKFPAEIMYYDIGESFIHKLLLPQNSIKPPLPPLPAPTGWLTRDLVKYIGDFLPSDNLQAWGESHGTPFDRVPPGGGKRRPI